MPSVMRPKVKVKSDSRPSAGTRIKSGGAEDMPVRVKALPEPRVGRGGMNEFKPMPAMGRIEGEPEPGMGQVFGGGPSGRGAEMGPDHIRPMPGGGPRGVFFDSRINPDGSHQGRNDNNEFDEWTPSYSDGQYRPSPYGDSSELNSGWLASQGRLSQQAIANGQTNDTGNPRLDFMPRHSGSSTGRLSQQAIANGQTNDTGNPRLDFMPRQGFREGEMDGQTPWEQMHKGRPLKKKKKKKRYTPNKPNEDYAEVMSGGVIKQPKGAK